MRQTSLLFVAHLYLVAALLTLSLASPALPQQGRCEPFQLVPAYEDIQEHCEYLKRQVTDKDADDFFAVMPAITQDMEFPLAGCVLGCPMGESWHGFRVDEDSRVFQKCFMNVVEGGDPAGVVLVNDVGGGEIAAKEITVQDSWSSSVRKKGRGLGVWGIEYDGDGYTGLLSGRKFTVVREEMKQAAANSLSVKAFAKVELDDGETGYAEFVYALFQVCTEDGEYYAAP